MNTLGKVVSVFAVFVAAGLILQRVWYDLRGRWRRRVKKIRISFVDWTGSIFWANYAYPKDLGSLLVPSDIEMFIGNDDPMESLLHEFGHLMVETIWLNEYGSKVTNKMVRNTNILPVRELLAWGYAYRMSAIPISMGIAFKSLATYGVGETNANFWLKRIISSPPTKNHILKSTEELIDHFVLDY